MLELCSQLKLRLSLAHSKIHTWGLEVQMPISRRDANLQGHTGKGTEALNSYRVWGIIYVSVQRNDNRPLWWQWRDSSEELREDIWISDWRNVKQSLIPTASIALNIILHYGAYGRSAACIPLHLQATSGKEIGYLGCKLPLQTWNCWLVPICFFWHQKTLKYLQCIWLLLEQEF